MISYAFVGVPPFSIVSPEMAQSVSDHFEKASNKVQDRVDDFKKTPTGQKISAAATSASDYMLAAFDGFLNRTEALVDSMLPPIDEPADAAHAEEESAATTPSCSTKENKAPKQEDDEKKPVQDAQQHQGELARALGLAGTVCSRVYMRADRYVIEPSKEYLSGLWEFWGFIWNGVKETCSSSWAAAKKWVMAKYNEIKEKAPAWWHSMKVRAASCWTWIKSVASYTFSKVKEYSLCLKNKAVEIYHKVLTPERKHAIQEVYKNISVKVYEYFSLAKDAVVKAARWVYATMTSVFTWENFENGWAAIGAAFACPWACGSAAAAAEQKA